MIWPPPRGIVVSTAYSPSVRPPECLILSPLNALLPVVGLFLRSLSCAVIHSQVSPPAPAGPFICLDGLVKLNCFAIPPTAITYLHLGWCPGWQDGRWFSWLPDMFQYLLHYRRLHDERNQAHGLAAFFTGQRQAFIDVDPLAVPSQQQRRGLPARRAVGGVQCLLQQVLVTGFAVDDGIHIVRRGVGALITVACEILHHCIRPAQKTGGANPPERLLSRYRNLLPY